MNAPGRTNWPAIILLVLVGVSAALEFAKVSTVFSVVSDHYAANDAAAAWFVSLPALFTIFFGLTGSVIAARIGFRRTLLWSLALAIVLSGLQAFLPPIGIFLAIRVLDGAVQLGIVVAAPVLILQLARPQARAFAMSMWGAFFGCAFALAGWVAPQLAMQFGLWSVFAAHAIFAAVLWLCVRLFLPRLPGDGPQSVATSEGFIRAHVAAYRLPRAVIPGAIFIFHTALYAVFVLFVPSFVDVAIAPILLIWMPLISIGGTLLSGVLTVRLVTPPVVLGIGFIGVVGTIIGIAFVGQSSVAGLVLPLVLMTFSGLIQGASFSLMPALSIDPEVTSRSNGVLMQLGNVGTLVGPPLFASAMAFVPGIAPVVPFALLTLVLSGGAAVLVVRALRLTGARPTTA
ncbi:MAG: MFS transporter [Agromyces sp.]